MKNNKDKTIMIVTHSAGNGGAERVSVTLANQFAEHGYNVIFYAIHSDTRDYYLDERIDYRYMPIKCNNKVLKQMERAMKLRKFVCEHDVDVMISFVYLEGLFLVGNKKLKKIYSLRNDPTKFLNTGIWKWLRDLIYQDAQNVVFQTPDARDYFDERIKKNGVIIPNPIRKELPVWKCNEHNNEIIAACRISEQKNLKMMLDAFKIFHAKNDQYRLVIYGQGTLKSYYEEYAKKLDLEKYVSFPGFCNDIQSKMADAAMYVSSSDYEGISNSMLEALAIGTPVVCTDCPVGGARMFITSGENGFLVETGNAEDMAEKMLQLIENEELQKSFSKSSQILRQQLSEEKIYEQWETLV